MRIHKEGASIILITAVFAAVVMVSAAYLLPSADGALALIAALVILTVVLALELRQRSPLNGKIKKST